MLIFKVNFAGFSFREMGERNRSFENRKGVIALRDHASNLKKISILSIPDHAACESAPALAVLK
jgi:hypothetical protein